MQVNPASDIYFQHSGRHVAVVGAGIAGAACALGLHRAGFAVTVFDKSHTVGGRLSTRSVDWTAADGSVRSTRFDHGCPSFTAKRPRFRATVDRAVKQGHAVRWSQHVYATFPTSRLQDVVVPTPDMPFLCRHLLDGVPQRLGEAVTGLSRRPDGWHLQFENGTTEGPFDQAVLAMPAAQAATLLAGHQQGWADALGQVRMQPCWTLMAVTDEVDWPWDVAEIEQGELGWIFRNDRKPGRSAYSDRLVPWVAHATPAWSLAHLEDDAASVTEVLSAALARLLPGRLPGGFRYARVHRWRYARLAQAAADDQDCWWNGELGLGVCGDAFGDGSVEAAWCSGDELADTVAASLEVDETHGADEASSGIIVPAVVPAPARVQVRSPAPARTPAPSPSFRREPGMAEQPR